MIGRSHSRRPLVALAAVLSLSSRPSKAVQPPAPQTDGIAGRIPLLPGPSAASAAPPGAPAPLPPPAPSATPPAAGATDSTPPPEGAARSRPPAAPAVGPGVEAAPALANPTGVAKTEIPERKPSEDGSGTVIVPLVVYTPEMHVGVGGLLVQFFRIGNESPDSRVSSVAFVALVTTRKQAIFEIHPDFYWDHEQNHIQGKFEYQRFPDYFWGIGPHAPDSAEESYQRERLRFRGGPSRRFFQHVYAGLSTDFMYFTAKYPDASKTFATQDVPGEAGGFTSGIGPSVAYDSRDNTVSTRSGTLLSGTWLGYAPAIGSRYEFWKLSTEARQFFPVGEESALGIRYYGEFQNGNVPYYQLAMLGGDELLRGYYLGRYRDRNLVVVEAEYRFPLFWKFGAVAFAGAGDVADRVFELPTEPIRWAAGGGLRLSLNSKERLNLRLDVGIGPDTFGAYFTAREAF